MQVLPQWRLVYIDKHRIRIVGYKAIEPNRKRRRKKGQEQGTGTSLSDVDRERFEKEVDTLAGALKDKKATLSNLRTANYPRAWQSGCWPRNKELYDKLRTVRQNADMLHKEIRQAKWTLRTCRISCISRTGSFKDNRCLSLSKMMQQRKSTSSNG